MSLRLLHLLPQNTSFNRNPQSHHLLTRPVTRIHCIRRTDDEEDDFKRRTRKPIKKKKKTLSDSDLAKELAREIGKANTVQEQRKEAMKKSSEILWREFCKHMGLKEDEMKNQWRKIDDEDEKMRMVSEFVNVWGFDFMPLSVRSVIDMVEEECLVSDQTVDDVSSSFSGLFPGLKRIIGFE